MRYADLGQPTFCTVLEGQCVLTISGQEPITLEEGDFVLMPATPGFTTSGTMPAVPVSIAPCKQLMHGEPSHPWTVDELAKQAALSRSAFFERFSRAVGQRPMEYLMTWRMALAKDLSRQGKVALDEVAERVGYSSASTFSTASSRHVGQSPGRYARGL